MSDETLDTLLEKLCTGDAAAADQVFRAYEPYLRMVVRRQLPARVRARFDSVDVVQSVWVDLLEGFRSGKWHFAGAAQLRAFLVKATRNRFIDRLRQHRRGLESEQSLTGIDAANEPAAPRSGPSEVLQAQELWDDLLAGCTAAQKEVLQLKRQGFALAEIAARTGLHPSSVRRILYDSARRLAELRAAPPPPASGVA